MFLSSLILVVDVHYDFVKCRFATADEGSDFLETDNQGYVNSTTFTLDEVRCDQVIFFPPFHLLTW